MTSITIRSNNLDNLVVGELNVKWSARGDRILRYYIDVRHVKMNLHKEVSAPELFILQSKMDTLIASWDEKYEHFTKKKNIISGHAAAEDLTVEAAMRLDSIESILIDTLKVDDRVDWEALKDKSAYDFPKDFAEPQPNSSSEPEPTFTAPKIGFFDLILGRKKRIICAAEDDFRSVMQAWQNVELQRSVNHSKAVEAWDKRRKAFWDDHLARKAIFEAEQASSHAEVERLKSEVGQSNEDAVIEHASLVLENSNYRGLFEKSYLIQYHSEKLLLKVAYDLPAIDVLPSTKVVKFVKATGELRESHITDREKKANFESACYQICLRTIHELFEADEYGNINDILFNGFVNYVDPATGVERRACLLSVLVNKATFSAIDLSRVEPKACFKSLRGVSAASLASLAAVPPVMEMDTEDRRFITAREVGSGMDEGTNLASISWDDFEHLVRELFEREFASRGGEVKVTQSSSDGGVDAVAFDPDPITGGKIVIQAKRYTRTVGVSAVRDLYGTVMNEGASRGILVTTADYGPDAYSFANGKPLTLMNGANLLHMMQRHGQKAKIDIKEARALMEEN
ncbi:MAG: restriction endonuclease [Proteobacteria bacterium ST_bin14]|nr:MAG: restriction endonuclease [Proteobacteria bacterium ST_bin14]